MITTTVSLSITPGGIEPIVNVGQYDVGSRTLLFDFGSSYSIPDGAIVSIRGTKPDKTGFAYSCTVDSGKASVVVQDQMTACAGRVPCEVLIEVDGTRLHSATLVLVVKPSALADDTKISESDFSILESVGDVSQSVRAAAASAAAAKTSESNAAASQKAAAMSASAAAVSESAAASHLSDAEDSASQAKSAANSAKTSAANAASSASAAAKSASSITTMTGATASAAGKGGTVPAPAAGKQDSALKGDGTYGTEIGGLDLQLSSSFINTWKSILGG